jgi:hypothetical protein
VRLFPGFERPEVYGEVYRRVGCRCYILSPSGSQIERNSYPSE